MLRFSIGLGVLATAAVAALPPATAQAQVLAQAQDWFIPGQQQPPPPPAQQRTAPPPRAARPPRADRGRPAMVPLAPAAGPAAGEPVQPRMQVALPPIPQLPALPKGPTPPAAVIGVLGVPEVMHASSAAQQVEKILGARREKLNQDAQKEQAGWRDLQQSLVNDRTKLSAEQIRSRERALQERITNAQRQFRERNKIIQDAAQYALAQIERTLIAVIRQVAESRGMNLVLHRAQVALNVNEFDITPQVAEQLNKILPAVTIPAEGQEPPMAANAAPAGAAASAILPTTPNVANAAPAAPAPPAAPARK